AHPGGRVPTHPAQLPHRGARARGTAPGDGDPRDLHPRLPRLRGAATDPRVGVDDRRGPRLRRHRLVADHAARARRHRRRPRRQSPELAPGENPMNVLEINNLNVAYSHQVVHDVSLSVKAGETVALVGESGSGKTTTAQSVLGRLPRGGRILSGSIRLSGTEIAGWSDPRMAAIRGPRIGWVPQDPGNSLNPVKRIGESLAEVMRIHKRGTPEQIRTRVVELLERVGIPQPGARARQYPHQLSGGMKQRVLIASAIAPPSAPAPELTIADEATSALDVTVQKSILDLLGDLRREQGTSILLVTHDLAVAADRAAQIAVLSQGRIVEAGRAADILTRPR